MPHISVSLYPGRTEEAKAEMAKKLNQCLVDACGWRPEDISVSFGRNFCRSFCERSYSKNCIRKTFDGI